MSNSAFEPISFNDERVIMIVDDDPTLLKFFKIHLNKFFSTVIVVETAAEAMKKLKEESIDLILSDVRMPRVDGVALMHKVKKKDPTIPFLLVSGAVGSEELEDEIRQQGCGFLAKPFSIEELTSFVEIGLELRTAYLSILEVVKTKKKFIGLLDKTISPDELRLNAEKKKTLAENRQKADDIGFIEVAA